MAGTRDLGENFETTDDGLHLHNKLVKTARTAVSIITGTLAYTVMSITASANLTRIVLEMPSLTAATVLGVITVENSDGVVIYESSTCGESDVHIIALNPAIPIVGTNAVKLTLDKDPGGIAAVLGYVTAYLEGK